MYSKQLLIKINEDMLGELQNIAKQMWLKVSTFARMVLKNYLNEKEKNRQDIEILTKRRKEKDYDFDDFISSMYDEYKNKKKCTKRT